MDKDLDIRVEGLGKRYQLGQTLDLNRTFRELLMGVPAYARHKAKKALTGAASSDGETPEGTFWALRDINLEIRSGEVVGIVGRNGAGKSTLLKILSRVTHPTSGKVEIRGRVGALLEVGTGFHPELTGRENIYLNGAILGMRRAEIDRKFDEIVSFAEVESFLETPVKRYSSGMRVRLGFAVAAHLEPEVLVIDEVLSVGDAAFRKKCLNKIQDVSGNGRTVLFISHNMASIRNLCPRSVLLESGRVVMDGPSRDVISAYLGQKTQGNSERNWEKEGGKMPGSEVVKLRSILATHPQTGESDRDFLSTEAIDLEFNYKVEQPSQVIVHFSVKDTEGTVLFFAGDFQDGRAPELRRNPGPHRSVCHLPPNFFSPGLYYIDVSLLTYSPYRVHCVEPEAVAFRVEEDFDTESARGHYARPQWPNSMIRPRFTYDFYEGDNRL